MSLNYIGVKGGTVLFVADDPGPISSQTEQDTRRFASFAKVPVLDPSTPEEGCAMMEAAFELSEAYRTPVIVRPTTRINHASTFMEFPEVTQARPVPEEGFERDPKWIIFPRRAFEAHGEINERLRSIAQDFAEGPLAQFNPIMEISAGGAFDATVVHDGAAFAEELDQRERELVEAEDSLLALGGGRDEFAALDAVAAQDVPRFGIVAGGVSAAYAREALRMLEGLARDAGHRTACIPVHAGRNPVPLPGTCGPCVPGRAGKRHCS